MAELNIHNVIKIADTGWYKIGGGFVKHISICDKYGVEEDICLFSEDDVSKSELEPVFLPNVKHHKLFYDVIQKRKKLEII